MNKRLISFLLAFVLAFSTLSPASAFAADIGQDAVDTVTEPAETAAEALSESQPEPVQEITMPEKEFMEEVSGDGDPSGEKQAIIDFAEDVDVQEQGNDAVSSEEEIISSGKCGPYLTWTLDRNGTLTISGTGRMDDDLPYYAGGPWRDYQNSDGVNQRIKNVVIEPGVTTIGEAMFYMHSNIESVTIPSTVWHIGSSAFGMCRGIKEITLTNKITSVGVNVFSYCNNLTDVYFYGTEREWSLVSSLLNLPTKPEVHYVTEQEKPDSGDIEETEPAVPEETEPAVPEEAKPGNGIVLSGTCGVTGENKGNVVWEFDTYSKTLIISGEGKMRSYLDAYGDWTESRDMVPWKHLFADIKHILIKPGVTNIGSYAFQYCKNLISLTIPTSVTKIERDCLGWENSYYSCRVKEIHYGGTEEAWENLRKSTSSNNQLFAEDVIMHFGSDGPKPPEYQLEMLCKYDSAHYYAPTSFFSGLSGMSDSVDIYLEYTNSEVEDLPDNHSFENVTLSATVSGRNLSFARNYDLKTFTASYGNVPYKSSICDLLMLYPRDPQSYDPGPEGETYTVEVTLSADNLKEKVVQSYQFTIYNIEQKRIDSHTDFAKHNHNYLVSKNNHYGKNMVGVKDDSDYLWSKWSSFDFENYYEVVIADILIGILDAPQMEDSLMPKVLKQWYGGFKSLLDGIDTMVTGKYGDVFDISETKISKILKIDKYRTGSAVPADNELYQVVMDLLGDSSNEATIQSWFAKADKTKQVADLVSLGADPIKEVIAWVNTLSVLNAFGEADEEMKAVFRTLADEIPGSQWRMKEAILDYVNYSHDFSGQVNEICDSWLKTAGKISLSTFNNVYGKKLWDWGAVKMIQWAGRIPLKGGKTFASTKAYATLSSSTAKAIGGSVLTGVSIGLTVSELICNSSSKASEMGKLIAMSEYSPYIVRVVQQYEDRLMEDKDNTSALLFHNAFLVHQAAQSYIMNQTANVLIVKGESILQKIFGNEEYFEVAADALAHKRSVDLMDCCSLSASTVVCETKIQIIRCPVDVSVTDSSGAEVVRIVSDRASYVADGIDVYIRDREKFIALPSNQDFDVRITATGSGHMDYLVREYDSALKTVRTMAREEIPLSEGNVFIGNLPKYLGKDPGDFALTSNGAGFVPKDLDPEGNKTSVPMYRMYDPNSGEHFYTGAEVERDFLVEAGWHYEGVGFNFPVEGAPVHRLYDPVYGEHLYTMDEAEMNRLLNKGWSYEGVAFNSAGKGQVAQYRLHNPNAKRGGYHFTGSTEERNLLISFGWIDQGIGWYSCWE